MSTPATPEANRIAVEELSSALDGDTLHYERLTSDADDMNICATPRIWAGLKTEAILPFLQLCEDTMREHEQDGGDMSGIDIRYMSAVRDCHEELLKENASKHSYDQLREVQKTLGQEWLDSVMFERDNEAPNTLARYFSDADGQTFRADFEGDSGVALQLGKSIRSDNAKLDFYRQMKQWPDSLAEPLIDHVANDSDDDDVMPDAGEPEPENVPEAAAEMQGMIAQLRTGMVQSILDRSLAAANAGGEFRDVIHMMRGEINQMNAHMGAVVAGIETETGLDLSDA